MQRDTDFLVRRIYDAVDNADALPEVLSGFCELIGGENGILGILKKTPGAIPQSGDDAVLASELVSQSSEGIKVCSDVEAVPPLRCVVLGNGSGRNQ